MDNYEERYKAALERARELSKTVTGANYEYIFPELVESEDERIRKELIEQVAYIIPNDDEVDGEGDVLPAYQKRIDKYRAWLEKQGGQKSADEAEPKFKVYDWVVTDKGDTVQIGAVNNGYYTIGNGMDFNSSYVDSCWHKWTIQDAKDGDVLAAHECYAIFKEIDGLNIKCYCTYHYMGFNPSFHVDTLHNKDAFHPATKEQRNTLFAKMKEAGFEWDAKKKELDNMEVASKESEDERIRKALIENFKFFGGDFLETSKWGKDDDLLVTDILAWLEKQGKKLDPDEVIAWIVANVCNFEYYVSLFKQDFKLWDKKN